MKRGVFWLLDDGELLAIPFDEESTIGLSKAGNNYNHKLLWDYVKPRGCNKPFDYYPRGRVELSNKGQPVVYMNRNIDENALEKIMSAFELNEAPKDHYDGSRHYGCHLDEKEYDY